MNQQSEVSDDEVGLPQWLSFLSVTLAASVYAAAWTLPNAVLPQMQGDLAVSLDQISLVVTATVVAGAVGIPLTPWLRQRLGTKRLLITALSLFSLTSIMVASVNSLEEVLLWRICSALAGSPIIALSQAVTMDTFPLSKRPLAFSIWSVGLAAGWVFAPTIGSWLADLVSWRLTFLSVAPFGAMALACCAMFMPAENTSGKAKLDWTGFLTLAIALTMAQTVINQGQHLDWFNSTEIPILVAVGLLSFYLYIVHTIYCKEPFLNWQIFKDRNLVLGLLITMVYGYIGLVPMVILPTMMEEMRGLEVFTTGLLVLPRGISNIIFMLVAGYFASRCDPRLLLAGGLATFAATSLYMAQYNLNIGVADILWPTIIQGASMAFIWVPAMSLMYATLKPHLRTSGATMVSLTYNLSSSFGVALAVIVYSRSSDINRSELSAFIEPANKIVQSSGIISDFSSSAQLASVASEISLQAAAISYANVFWLLAMSAVVVLPLTFFQRRPAST
ncbi:MAG: DHA2 family multidrug resistance protein [Parasphingorhabdus sp.]